MAGLRSVLLGVLGLSAASSFGGDATAAEIQMDGPRSCSRATELRARVERALGRSLGELGAVSCSVHMVRDGGSYAARVEMSSSERAQSLQRSFSAKTCPKLMDTLELALVLALGTDHGTEASDAADPSVSAAVSSAQAAFSLLDAARRSARADAIDSSTDASLALDASPLAKEAPIAKPPAAFTLPAASTSLEGAPFAAAPHAAGAPWRAFGGVLLDAGTLPGPVELTLSTGTVLGRAPLLESPGGVELGPCAGGELGASWSRHGNPIRNDATQTLGSAPQADLGARWQVTPSWLSIDARLGYLCP